MKKTLITASIILMGLVTKAQVAIGIKAGANLTKITGKAYKEQFELGYNAGAFAEIKLTKGISLQPEVLFNQVNTKKADSINQIYSNWQNSGDIQLNYLTIPLLLRINFNEYVALNLGPQFGILLSKNESIWDQGKQAIKSGDLSAIGGITVSLKSLRVFARYVIGLNNINDIPNSDSWKSQQIQLGVGYKF